LGGTFLRIKGMEWSWYHGRGEGPGEFGKLEVWLALELLGLAWIGLSFGDF
jgi:hypothetical protein